MTLICKLLIKLRTLGASPNQSKSRQTGSAPPKRFPFIWLCLLLTFCPKPTGYCHDNLTIAFESVGADRFAQLAADNLFSLPTQKIGYATYPVILRPIGLQQQPELNVTIISNWRDHTGKELVGASLAWSASTWVWEGREEHGPAPGLQFSALIPVLAEPGIYTATVQVHLSTDGVVIHSFPLHLSLTVPSWAACRAWPQQLQAYQKGLAEPGRRIIETEHIRYIIAANTDWSLWVQSDWLPAPRLAGRGTSTLGSRSGYLIDTFRLQKEHRTSEGNLISGTNLRLLLRF